MCPWCFSFCKPGLSNKNSTFCRASHPSLMMRWREGALGAPPNCGKSLGWDFGWVFELWAARGNDSHHPVRYRSTGGEPRLHGPGWQGTSPAPAPPALLCLLSRWIFPSSGLGLCGGEAADGESRGALIGGDSVLKCHKDLYLCAASPGANCATGPWIMAPGENNPSLPCSPASFFSPFLFTWWI